MYRHLFYVILNSEVLRGSEGSSGICIFMGNEPKKEIIEKSSLEYYFNQEEEINLFHKWIFDVKRVFRDLVYLSFPELTDLHLNKNNLSSKKIHERIREVVLKFREKHADNIKQFETSIISDLPVISAGINSLEKLMKEDDHYKYLVMPTVYTVCPFDENRNLFYFTITGVKDGKVRDERLSTVTLHEISHFIFFRQLEKIPNKLSKVGIHHLKEVLAPVILDHPEILEYRHDKKLGGNPESVKYQVEVGGEVMSIFDYVKREYFKNPTPDAYMPFLHWLIDLFEKIEPEVIKRDDLFCKNGKAIFTDLELNAKFMEPIKIL